jgi:PAS domain S-box-containing protein
VKKSLRAFAISIGALIAAVLIRWLLDPLLGDAFPLVPIGGAIAAAVWVGGYRPAVLIAVLGYLICDYLFIEPRGQLAIANTKSIVGIIAFTFATGLIIAFGQAMRVAQLRASQRQELLRVTLGSIGDAVITTGVDGHVTYLNAAAELLTGWTNPAAQGQPLDAVFRIIDESTRQPVESPATRALREGIVVGLTNHTLLIRKDGSELSIDDSAAPIRDDSGRVSGCVLTFRDVTEQRRAVRDRISRLQAARMLAAIVESSDDAIISKSLDGIIQSWNAAAERLFGHPASVVIGRHISLIIPPERIAEEDHIIAMLKAGKRIEHFETERVGANGRLVQVSLTVSPVKDDAGNVVGASKIARDITERRRTEAERQRFVTLVESSTDFVGICDLNAVPFYINRAGLEMVGLDDVEAARKTSVRDFFFPEDRPRIVKEFFPQVQKDGHGEIEIRFRHFKTGAARWMVYKVLTLTDPDGKPNAFATVSQDITERKKLEDNLRQLAASLSDADRRKDEFLATLAHELRNPLAPIRNALQVVRRSPDPEAQEQAHLVMQRQLEQMVRLVDDLLDVSRITRGKLELRREVVSLAEVLNAAVETSRPAIDRMGHTLTVTLPNQPVRVDADPVRLAQVFSNLLNNSAKYMDRGGHIWLTAELHGRDVAVSVKDAGIGIAPEQLPHIFEMFSQVEGALERSQGGLGIGLTLVKRLIEMHGGRIEARSAGIGKGAEFIVRLPAAVGAAAPTATPDAEPVPTSALRILVVDDNRDGADSLVMLLRIMGNETRTAYDGEQGVATAAEYRPDVILLDIGLPKLNGYEACRRIREQPWGKDLLIVAVTGWGQEDDHRHSREAGFDYHMVKPVDTSELMRLLADVRPPGATMVRSSSPNGRG